MEWPIRAMRIQICLAGEFRSAVVAGSFTPPSSAQNLKTASPDRERYRLLSTANRLVSVSAKLRTHGVAGEQNPPPNAYRDQDRKQDLTN